MMNSIIATQEKNIIHQNGLVVTKTLIGQAEDLAQEHEQFYDGYIVAGRKALYELLGKIYALSEQLDAAVDREEQVELLRNILARRGIRTQENSSTTAILVRYITRADRKTTHVYAKAIEAAKANRIRVGNFVDFVEEAGGIDRIRSNSADIGNSESDNQDTNNLLEEMLELAKNYLHARSEFPIASFKLSKKFLIEQSNSGLKHFICYERQGRQYVLSQLPVDKKLEISLLKDYAKILCKNLSFARRKIGRAHV